MTTTTRAPDPAALTRRRIRVTAALSLVVCFAACLAVQAALADHGSAPAAAGASAKEQTPNLASGLITVVSTGVAGGSRMLEPFSLALFGVALLAASRALRRTAQPHAPRRVVRSGNVTPLTRRSRLASGESGSHR